MFKNTLLTLAMITAASPVFADTTKATIDDVYKSVIEQQPYKVEVCRDVQVPVHGSKEMDTGGAIVGGIIGGVIGNQFGKGDGKDAMTGIGAVTGAILGGQKEGKPQYRWERQCSIETRYTETKTKVYSHSTATFVLDGKTYTIKFTR
jgi:uncharacterized protein YcfJ